MTTVRQQQHAMKPKCLSFETEWPKIEKTVIKILTFQAIDKVTWDYNFTEIYHLCIAVPRTYEKNLFESVRNTVKNHVETIREHLTQCNGDVLITKYVKLWDQFHEASRILHTLFYYLNRILDKQNCILNSKNRTLNRLNDIVPTSIGSLALDTWKKELVLKIRDALYSAVFDTINKHREGFKCDSIEEIHSVINSFVLLDKYETPKMSKNVDVMPDDFRETMLTFYSQSFEQAYLTETRAYCNKMLANKFSALPIREYMEKILNEIENERRRARLFLDPSSESKVHEVCLRLMVDQHKKQFDDATSEILYEEDEKYLKIVFKILEPLKPDGLSILIKEFHKKAVDDGIANVWKIDNPTTPQLFVDNVIIIYNKYNNLVKNVFNNAGEFTKSLDNAMHFIVNYKENPKIISKASERTAKYVDSLLKRAKNVDEKEIDANLSKSIIIFKYLEDKDSFQKFYSKMLANRLIHNLSSNHDYEELMVAKLKEACGYEFTAKLCRMFSDVNISKELCNGYLKSTYCKSQTNVSINFNVLQACAWPYNLNSLTTPSSNQGDDKPNTPPPPPLLVGQYLEEAIQNFEAYYHTKHNGRKLSWLYNTFTVDIKNQTDFKNYLITMNITQASIWLLFEGNDSLTVEEISQRSGLTYDIVVKNLKIFVEHLLLLCEDLNFSPTSKVEYNTKYQGKRMKFRLPQPQHQKIIEKEAEQVTQELMHDRKYYIECVIVRIMKTRKVIKHNDLISEIITQTKNRFTPDMAFIKRNIESLIDKMYLKRADNRDEYHYLA
uniref:CULLIN_2 domain-containing protein n=1 Tax=Parastrongyloides trichosuri TaxID=131310 RepID=A0A0N4Z6N9_PARTI